MILKFADINYFLKTELAGVIVDANSNRPIADVFVYIEKEKDEVFTDIHGIFHFITWQEKPFKVTAEHEGFLTEVFPISANSFNIKISLKKIG